MKPMLPLAVPATRTCSTPHHLYYDVMYYNAMYCAM
jgi:hypothetical protein